jgi:hypothetical protein
MKTTNYRGAVVMTLFGLVFLVPQVWRTINGEPLSFTPGMATAIGLFLGAAISLVIRRESGDRSEAPGA